MTPAKFLLLGIAAFVHVVYSASYTADIHKKFKLSSETNEGFKVKGHGTAPEFDEHGHWFANGFQAGNSKNLEFLIDTGSADCLIGAARYHKGPTGKYTGKNFTIVYYPDPKNNRVTGKIYQDSLSFAGLSFPKQKIGIFPSKSKHGQAGIIGFSGPKDSSFGSPSWFYNLCRAGYLDECRFGLAYGTNKTGKQIFGKVDKSLISSPLTVAPRFAHPNQHWGVRGDVLVDGQLVDEDAALLIDSGTDRIFSPLNKIRGIFKILRYDYKYHQGNPKDPKGEPSFVRANFPCNATLDLGFRIPSMKTYEAMRHTDASISEPKVFKVGQSYWGPPLRNPEKQGNCTSILWGSNQFSKGFGFGPDGWLVGQGFQEGLYLDHNLGAQTMGFAELVNPASP